MFMFEKLCRLCITDESVSSTLNNSDSDNITLLDKLNLLAPGILQMNSSLPVGICTTCIAQINQACKFIKNCLRSQEILNKYLEQLKNGLDTEQGENSKIKIIAIRLEQNKLINYMNYMNIEQNNEEFLNTLVNYEEESGFIKQENIIEYNDAYESIQANFEDDIGQEETNVKMEISEEECNNSIDVQSDMNVKEESLSEEQLYETDIIHYECTVVKFEDEIKIEDYDSKNAILDIPTITKQSDFCGFNSTEYGLANDIKVKYNFELNRLCKNTNKFLIVNWKNVRKALKRSSNTKARQNNSKDSSVSKMAKKVRKNQSDITKKICRDKRSYECKICDKCFDRRANLRTHIRIHTGEKPFQCTVCKKAFAQKGDLTRHIRTHTREKPFQCTVCKKACAQKGDLIKHIRTHTGKKPFQCKTCTQAFAQKGHLMTHIRTHTGEKPFECKVCTQAFSQKGHLMTHIRTHTGEKPFECKVCKKAFKQKSNLNRHVRTHTT